MRMNEQGRSMIEMLGVLAIVGVLSVGGIAGYSKAMNKFKTNKVIDQINMLSTNIRTLYSSQRSYSGLKNSVAKQAGVVPGEMYDPKSVSTEQLSHGFAGPVSIKPTQQNSADDSFAISVYDIPQASCVTIATTDWGSDAGSGLVSIGISTGKSTDAASSTVGVATMASATTSGSHASGAHIAVVGDQTYGTPIAISDAMTSCSSANYNIITWKFL